MKAGIYIIRILSPECIPSPGPSFSHSSPTQVRINLGQLPPSLLAHIQVTSHLSWASVWKGRVVKFLILAQGEHDEIHLHKLDTKSRILLSFECALFVLTLLLHAYEPSGLSILTVDN